MAASRRPRAATTWPRTTPRSSPRWCRSRTCTRARTGSTSTRSRARAPCAASAGSRRLARRHVVQALLDLLELGVGGLANEQQRGPDLLRALAPALELGRLGLAVCQEELDAGPPGGVAHLEAVLAEQPSVDLLVVLQAVERRGPLVVGVRAAAAGLGARAAAGDERRGAGDQDGCDPHPQRRNTCVRRQRLRIEK